MTKQKKRQKPEKGWVGLTAAAKILKTDTASLYNRRSSGTLPWDTSILQVIKDETVRGGQRYLVHEENLRAWAKKHPVAAAKLQRKPRAKAAKPAKAAKAATPTTPTMPTESQAKGVFVTRQDCMRAMTQTIATYESQVDQLTPQKFGSLFYDAVAAYTTTCCGEAAKQVIADEKFKAFYLQSKFCPLCGKRRR